jgi:O-antigen/teichoic acid export membrane protein
MSVKRSATNFGAATAIGHASQLLWIVAGSRVMSPTTFGSVLAAQALYGVLQIVVDNGTATIGARMAARNELETEQMGEIVRIRLTLALAMAPLAVVLGVLGVSGSLAATLPFVGALVLFAIFNVWQSYGAGESRPFAIYLFMRSALPATVVVGMLAVGLDFPAALAGLLECAVLVALILLFRQRPLHDARLAARARGGPWRSVLSVGVPAIIIQASVAGGTLILSGFGSPAAAGILAAGVRLLTGLNSVNGIITVALFPRLARGEQVRGAGNREVATFALRLIAMLSAAATGVCVLLSGPISDVLLEHATASTGTTIVLTTATAASMSSVVMYSSLLIASKHEGDLLPSYVAGAAITVGAGIAAVALAGTRVELVAAALLAGQLVSMGGLGVRTGARLPELRGESLRAMALAALVAAVATASLIDGLAAPAGVALLLLATVLLRSIFGVLGDLRARRAG